MGARRLGLTVAGALGTSILTLALWSALASAEPPPAPIVDSESSREVGITTASVVAQVNPMGFDTTYHFEYGTDTSYGTSIPLPDSDIGSETSDSEVVRTLSGLQAGTSYHYRVVAVNANGIAEGPDRVFTTFAEKATVSDTCSNAVIRAAQFSSYLPECRAYELVSPVEKSGGNVAAEPRRTLASSDGNAIKYTSLNAFGDAPGIEADGAEYIARRGPDGWINHAINPVQEEGLEDILSSSTYVGFSEDLSKGVYFAKSPVLTGYPNVEKVANLFLRKDLLAPPPGSYELLDDSVSQVPGGNYLGPRHGIEFDGASADWNRLIFETHYNLTADTEGLSQSSSKLYEWHNGVVSLAGILPDGTPAEQSVAGAGGGGGQSQSPGSFTQQRHTISSDGLRIVFEGGALQNREGNVMFGDLYMRIDGSQTIQLNVSERAEPDPKGPQPVAFYGANPDDSKVLFLTGQELTDNATEKLNLYMYDMNAPEGKHLTLISEDHEPSDQTYFSSARGVVGTSSDLSYIYFVGDNKLVAGQPSPEDENESTELYVWHEGEIRAIVPRNDYGERGNWGEYGPRGEEEFRVTPDGKTVVFASSSRQAARMVGYDNRLAANITYKHLEIKNCEPGYCRELYVYRYDTNKVACASCDPTGARPVGDGKFERLQDFFPLYGLSALAYLQSTSHPLTDDGQHLFFDTRDALVAQDTNGEDDVYEYDVLTAQVHLLSEGTCGCSSVFIEAGRDGRNVFFVTHQPLVKADIDTNGDVYDARIEGGIDSQNHLPPALCDGDDCQGPAKGVLVFSLPASSTFSGSGNATTGAQSPHPKVRSRAQKSPPTSKGCKRKPKRKRAICEAKTRKGHRSNRSAKHASHRAGR